MLEQATVATVTLPVNDITTVKLGEAARYCEFCLSTNTPTWRRGPTGKGSLCNACGIKWRLKKKIKRSDDQRPTGSSETTPQHSPTRKRKESDPPAFTEQSPSPTASPPQPSSELSLIVRDRDPEFAANESDRRGKRYYCKYCDTTFSQAHFRNSQQFGAHCSNCSRRAGNPSSPPSVSLATESGTSKRRQRTKRVTADADEALEYGLVYREEYSSSESESANNAEEEFYDCEGLDDQYEYVPSRKSSTRRVSNDASAYARSSSTSPEAVTIRTTPPTALENTTKRGRANSLPSLTQNVAGRATAEMVAAAAVAVAGPDGLLARLLNAVEHQIVEETELAQIRQELQGMRNMLVEREEQRQNEIARLKVETKSELELIRAQVSKDLGEREKLYRREFDQLSHKFISDISNREEDAKQQLSLAESKLLTTSSKSTQVIVQSVAVGSEEGYEQQEKKEKKIDQVFTLKFPQGSAIINVESVKLVEDNLLSSIFPPMREQNLIHHIEVMQAAMKAQFEDSKSQIEVLQEALKGVTSECY